MRDEPAIAGTELQRIMLVALVFHLVIYRATGMSIDGTAFYSTRTLKGPPCVIARTVHGSGVRKRHTRVAACRLKRVSILRRSKPVKSAMRPSRYRNVLR